MVVDMQQKDVNLRVVTIQQTDANLRVVGTQRMDTNPGTINAQYTGGNPRVEIIGSYRQIPVGDKGHIENLPATGEVFTIFMGSHEAENDMLRKQSVLPRCLCTK